MFKLIVFLIAAILIYRILFKMIFPVLNIGSATSERLRQMQDQLNEMNQRANQQAQQKPSKKKDGEYIDYEEVK